jgi:hypothetical protein
MHRLLNLTCAPSGPLRCFTPPLQVCAVFNKAIPKFAEFGDWTPVCERVQNAANCSVMLF